jgi:hypothetical protein
VKLQKEPLSRFRETLKREWAVLPPGIIEAATPDVAVATAILFWLRIVASKALYK